MIKIISCVLLLCNKLIKFTYIVVTGTTLISTTTCLAYKSNFLDHQLENPIVEPHRFPLLEYRVRMSSLHPIEFIPN